MIEFQKPEAVDKEIILIQDKVVMTKMDKEGILEFANEYFVEVSGYEEFELMGKSIFCVQHPDMPDVLFKWMWEKLNKQVNFNFPVKSIAKNGKFYWSITDFSFKVDENKETVAIYNRRKFASRDVVKYFSNLYEKIKSIEKESGIVLAEKYLIGHLEEKDKTIKEIILDLDTNVRMDKTDSNSKSEQITKISIDDHPIFEKKPVQIDIENLPKKTISRIEREVDVIPKTSEVNLEALSIQERIDKIREKANKVSTQNSISKKTNQEIKAKSVTKIVDPIKEVVKKEPTIEKEKAQEETILNETTEIKKEKKSIFQKLFGKTEEEIEEEKRRRGE